MSFLRPASVDGCLGVVVQGGRPAEIRAERSTVVRNGSPGRKRLFYVSLVKTKYLYFTENIRAY